MAVEVQSSGRVCRVTLNRPEKLNALNEDVRSGLDRAVALVRDDPGVSVVVLSGAGRCFSAGADLTASAPADPGEQWSVRRHRSGAWQRTLDAVEALPQVTVASLHGYCIGGAALLAASCDIRVADPTVLVTIPEQAIGIPLTWGGIPRLVREIGLPLTRDLVMTGRPMAAEEALRCGFVQRLSPPDGLAGATDALVAELLAMPPATLAMTKAMTTAIGRGGLMAAAWADADLLQWSGREPESRQAAAAYAAKLAAR